MKKEKIQPLPLGMARDILYRIGERYAKGFHCTSLFNLSRESDNTDFDYKWHSWDKGGENKSTSILLYRFRDPFIGMDEIIFIIVGPKGMTEMKLSASAYNAFVFTSMDIFGEAGLRWANMLFRDYRSEARNAYASKRLEEEKERCRCAGLEDQTV